MPPAQREHVSIVSMWAHAVCPGPFDATKGTTELGRRSIDQKLSVSARSLCSRPTWSASAATSGCFVGERDVTFDLTK